MDIIKECSDSNRSLEQVALAYEMKKTDHQESDIRSYLLRALGVMMESAIKGLDGDAHGLAGKVIGRDSQKMVKHMKTSKSVCGETVSQAVAYALNTMQVNASMGKVVASPTAGSCGVLPAAMMTMSDRFDLTESKMVDGLLVAGLIGSIVANKATISGAEGGCQAEVGTASAMASGAVVHMMGGTPEQVFNAAAMCFKNLLGLVCDPIAGLVESPCAKRNAMGVTNALMCAEMSLAGIQSVVPFDEVVLAMYRIGKSMPPSLRETANGGLAVTPTGIRISLELYGK
jgi:L-serine dehydratase